TGRLVEHYVFQKDQEGNSTNTLQTLRAPCTRVRALWLTLFYTGTCRMRTLRVARGQNEKAQWVSSQHRLQSIPRTKQLKTADRLRLRHGQHDPNKVWTEVMLADQEPLLVADGTLRKVFHNKRDYIPRVNCDCELCNAVGAFDPTRFAEPDIVG
ncbi:hypothetical protein PENTCL1PPCAC_22079, partial [Pristionchus entomophagus]